MMSFQLGKCINMTQPPRSFAFGPWPLGGGRILPDPWWRMWSKILFPPELTEPHVYCLNDPNLHEWLAFGVTSVLADLVSDALHLWITLETRSFPQDFTTVKILTGCFEIILFTFSLSHTVANAVVIKNVWLCVWNVFFLESQRSPVIWFLWSQGTLGQTHKD